MAGSAPDIRVMHHQFLLRPFFIAERCSRTRLSSNQCSKCLVECPSNALTIRGNQFDIHSKSCTGCMACVAICPLDGISSDFRIDTFIKQCSETKEVVVSCLQQPKKHYNEVTIPCVGILSTHLLINLASCTSELHFDLRGCGGCVNHTIVKRFEQRYNELTEIFPKERLKIYRNHDDHIPKNTKSRRAFFKDMGKLMHKLSLGTVNSLRNSELENARSIRRIPLKTALIQSLISCSEKEKQQQLMQHFCYYLKVLPHCDCCPLCKGICPTGALTINKSEAGKKLHFNTLKCSGCGLCVEWCSKKALQLKAPPVEKP